MKLDLDSIKSAVGDAASIETINQLFEQTEASLNAYKSYETTNAQEHRNQVLLLEEYSRSFQQLLRSTSKNIYANPISQDFGDFNNFVLEERKKHAKTLETKMNTVNHIMKECNSLINTQGQVLDRIDSEIESVKTSTQKAANEVQISKSRQRHKRRCLTIVLVIALILILGIIIVAFVLGKS